ncbi:hypothetical protein [Clostridium baratii]|uniref:hypothetical protein n=1 Tax=Clostridium baratii TaxID=1561 RepID=UPI003D793353
MKKTNDNKLFWQIIIFSCLLLLIISIISSKFFTVNNIFDYRGWITLVISFSGSLIGGICTMLGVIKTIKNEKQNKNIEKQDNLNNIRLRIKIEVELSLKSIKDYYINMLKAKLNWIRATSQNMDQYITIDKSKYYDFDSYTMFDCALKANPNIPEIFFLDLAIKNDFYILINNVKINDTVYRESILNEFFELYTFEKKILKLSKIHSIKDHKFMININRKDINKDFFYMNLQLISRYLSLKTNKDEIEDIIKKMSNDINNLEKKDIFENRYLNLTKFLSEECKI